MTTNKTNNQETAESLLKKFGDKMNFLKKTEAGALTGTLRFASSQTLALICFYVLWGLGMLTGGDVITEGGRNEGINFFAGAVSQTDIDVGNRVATEKDSFWAGLGAAALNPLKETYTFSNIKNKDAIAALESKTVYDLRVVRAYVGLVLMLVSTVLGILTARNTIKTINEDERKANKIKIQEINKLLTVWKNKDIKTMQLEDFRYMDMIKKIISHMSSQDASLFIYILNGENCVSPEITSSILTGHLKSHPEDAQLVLDTITNAPQDVLAKCKEITNQR